MNVRRSPQFTPDNGPATFLNITSEGIPEAALKQRATPRIDLRYVVCNFLPSLSLLVVLHALVPFLMFQRAGGATCRASWGGPRNATRHRADQHAQRPTRLRSIVDPFSLAIVMMIAAQDTGGEEIYLLWGFVLLGAVIVLVLIELFVPSGGILGAMAGVAGIGSIVAFFMYDTTGGLVALSLYLVLTPIMLWAIYRYWLHSPLAGKMILGGVEEISQSFEDAVAESERARAERLAQLRQLIGAEGETATALRPVGTVKIDGQRVDALAESGTIEPGTRVVVTDVYDNQIKVRPV